MAFIIKLTKLIQMQKKKLINGGGVGNIPESLETLLKMLTRENNENKELKGNNINGGMIGECT